MKKFKVLLSVLLSIMMLIGCMPLAGLVSAEETEDKVYTIFMADPAKMGAAGTNVNAKITVSMDELEQTVIETIVYENTVKLFEKKSKGVIFSNKPVQPTQTM